MGVDPGSLDLTPMLAPERAALLELLRGLSDADWQRPTECPEWDVKGVALHVLGDDLSLLSRQRDACSENSLILFAKDHPGLSFREILDGFNELWVTASRFLSNELLIELLRLVGEWSETFYSDVGLDTMSREPVGFFATNATSPYWQVIAREFVERFVHQSQIRRAVGAPELDGELVKAAGRVVVLAIAAWLRDYEQPVGSTIVIDFGGAGSWTWRREPNHWSVVESATAAPTASVAVAPGRTVVLLSRGVSRDEARSSFTIGGDQAVAGGALDLIVPMIGS